MAEIASLRGYRYNQEVVPDLAAVVTPPYDVISPAEQAALYALSPYNAVRLILPREDDRAAAAGRTLREWIEARVLLADGEPALYVYSQRFVLPDGRALVRDGVICRLRLEEFASGVVRPHERTFIDVPDKIAVAIYFALLNTLQRLAKPGALGFKER